MSVIDLNAYATFLDETYISNNERFDINNENSVTTSNSSLTSHDSHLVESNKVNHEEEQFVFIIEQLYNQQHRCSRLSENLTILENKACIQKMNSLIVTGTSAIQQLKTELASVRSAIQNLSLNLAINKGPTLPLNKSAQRAFVETASLLSKLSNTLEETEEFLKIASNIDWETVKNTMEEFLRCANTSLSALGCIYNEASGLISIINESNQ